MCIIHVYWTVLILLINIAVFYVLCFECGSVAHISNYSTKRRREEYKEKREHSSCIEYCLYCIQTVVKEKRASAFVSGEKAGKGNEREEIEAVGRWLKHMLFNR